MLLAKPLALTKEETQQALFTVLTGDSMSPEHLMHVCKSNLLPFVHAVAQQVETAQQDASWQHWLATWLSVVQGTMLLLETGLSAFASMPPETHEPAGEGNIMNHQDSLNRQKLEAARADALTTWQGVTMQVGLALSSGNVFVIRAGLVTSREVSSLLI
jgi:hypothetical protein